MKAISCVENMGEKNNFLLSIRASLQYYRRKVAVLGDINPLSVTHIVRLLRFLSLLCEGHNHTAQSFLARNNVVSEVASFVEEICNVLSTAMNLHFAADDVIARDNLPVVGLHEVAMIKWIGLDGQLIDLNKLTLLTEVVYQGFETLSEFCQGFVFENQATITRAGPFKHLQVFSKFFGAYQLVMRSPYESDHVDNAYRDRLKAQLTHESVIPLNTVTSNKLLWLGNDPLAQEALFAYHKKFVSPQSSRASFTTKYANLRDLVQLSGKAENCYEVGAFELVKKLTDEKALFLDSLRDDVEVDVSLLEENTYYRILRFGEVLTQLESSSLKLVQSVLEGSRVDEDEELCRIAFNSFGTSNIMINMTNYWTRFKSFKTDYRYRQEVTNAENCFERQMAFDYYAMAKRFCDMPHIDTNNLEIEMTGALGRLKIHIDEVLSTCFITYLSPQVAHISQSST